MRTNKNGVAIFIALIPIIVLVTTSYFNNKSSECYTILAETRYNINNSNFESFAAQQQFNGANEAITKISENPELRPTNPPSKENLESSISYIKNLIQNSQNILSILQNNSSTLINIPIQSVPLFFTSASTTHNQEAKKLIFSIGEFSTNLLTFNLIRNQSLLKEELSVRERCSNYSNLATMFLYISLGISVIIPILEWVLIGTTKKSKGNQSSLS